MRAKRGTYLRRASENANMKTRQTKSAKDQSNATPEFSVDIVGTRIRDYREAKGITIAQIAERAGIQPTILEAVENGKTDPTLALLSKIAESLEVSVADLFGPLSPRAILVAKTWEEAPAEIQSAVKTILTHPLVKA